MSVLRVYRIEVTKWPTDDGLPWARFYGPGAAAPNREVPGWLQALIDEARPRQWRFVVNRTPLDRIADRIKWDDDRNEFAGVLMQIGRASWRERGGQYV